MKNMSEKKVVLLTGSTGGLGKKIAKGLALKGYHLALHYHTDESQAISLINKLEDSQNHKIFVADLTEESQIKKMITAIVAEFGGIDIVINNAGKSFSGMSWKQTAEDWNTIMKVNVTAVFLINKYVIPHLRKQKNSRIINISSIVANRPLLGTSAYAASKAALEGFTRAQAIELSRFGITANCIAPGYFNTGMINGLDSETRENLIREIPSGRLGNPEELVECIVYLCSELSAYMTGQVIALNGGLYL